jgi:hypothetical protein
MSNTGDPMLSWLSFIPLSALSAPISRAQTERGALDRTIQTVESMVRDSSAVRTAKRHGLSLVNVSWEDTGRSKNSALGPNISDMTIGVRDSQGKLHPMPVYRFDNYHDKTADLEAENIWMRTGNAHGNPLQNTRLVDLLDDLRDHLSRPSSLASSNDSMMAARDSHFLVSAQACFLPISHQGKATFTPVIYNYQSRSGHPAVLTIVATREGTSIQVVENDSGYMSEVLYFNDDGKRAPFTATRLSTFKKNGGDETTSAEDASEDAGLDVVLIIQVPLKTQRPLFSPFGLADEAEPIMLPSAAPMEKSRSAGGRSNVETAVIGHGKTEGPFKEINGLEIKRDPRFPVRVTAQFYKATSNGVATSADVAALRAQIDKVYADGDYVGSLVSEGLSQRPTEWVGRKPDRHSIWSDPVWDWHKAF